MTIAHVEDELPDEQPELQPQQGEQQHPAEPVNPALAPLKAMFPDFDDAVMQSVLDSVNGNQDAAVDVLLGMSDPDYVSTHQSSEHHPEQASSLELDEQLARQLQLEDQEQAQQQQQRQRARGQTWQPRQRGDSDQNQPAAEGGNQDNFQEIKETFNQIAESGKRTFSSIVSRVKAKINEYDQSKPNNTQGQQPPNWGSSSSQQPSAQGSPNPASYPNYYAETPASQPVDRHAASQAYAPYYAGATRAQAQGADDDGWQQVAARGRPTEQKPVAAPEVKGYDIDGPAAGSTEGDLIDMSDARTPAAAPQPVAQPEPAAAPAAGSSPPSDVPRPPTTQSGSPLNAAKFGLLPKRPVSLLTPQTSAAKHPDDEDEDELDYVENPFEERHNSK